MNDTVKIIISVLIGVGVGAACRWFKLPVPAPPTLIGAMLVTSITVGYLITDHLMSSPPPAAAQALSEEAVRKPAE
ncbi:MAG TPA: DUF1427 family protein [Acidobacteriota bacterium]|nr:DUF1427 family protein [Acidobacteriota bacterium]